MNLQLQKHKKRKKERKKEKKETDDQLVCKWGPCTPLEGGVGELVFGLASLP